MIHDGIHDSRIVPLRMPLMLLKNVGLGHNTRQNVSNCVQKL